MPSNIQPAPAASPTASNAQPIQPVRNQPTSTLSMMTDRSPSANGPSTRNRPSKVRASKTAEEILREAQRLAETDEISSSSESEHEDQRNTVAQQNDDNELGLPSVGTRLAEMNLQSNATGSTTPSANDTPYPPKLRVPGMYQILPIIRAAAFSLTFGGCILVVALITLNASGTLCPPQLRVPGMDQILPTIHAAAFSLMSYFDSEQNGAPMNEQQDGDASNPPRSDATQSSAQNQIAEAYSDHYPKSPPASSAQQQERDTQQDLDHIEEAASESSRRLSRRLSRRPIETRRTDWDRVPSAQTKSHSARAQISAMMTAAMTTVAVRTCSRR